MLMRAATVVQVLQDLFYVLLHVLFYLCSLLKRLRTLSNSFDISPKRTADADATQLDSFVASASAVCIGQYAQDGTSTGINLC